MLALGETLILERRLRLDEDNRRDRRQVVRQQLIKQRGRKLRELALELELDPRRHERATFKQAGDRGVHLLFEQPAEPLGHAWIFLGEFLRSLVENFQLAVVMLQELAVHVATGSRVSCTLPEPTSTSATNSIGTSRGRQDNSPDTTKRIRWFTSSNTSFLSTRSVSRWRRGSKFASASRRIRLTSDTSASSLVMCVISGSPKLRTDFPTRSRPLRSTAEPRLIVLTSESRSREKFSLTSASSAPRRLADPRSAKTRSPATRLSSRLPASPLMNASRNANIRGT